jgi:glycosyltransferase involved in cell wall biosynthesis
MTAATTNSVEEEKSHRGENRDWQSQRCLVSVVVPVYNEHRTVAQVVDSLLELEVVGEVVIVDDGSDEATRRALDELAIDRRVRVLRHPINRGKGAALRSGFAVCAGRVIVIQDADSEYPPEALPAVVQPIFDGEADIVYGSRELGNRYQGVPWVRRAANRSLTWLSNRMTGLELTDMETGCKAFRREVLESICLKENRFGIEPEITAKAAAAGWRFKERPIHYSPRDYHEGKKIRARDGMWAVWCIARYSSTLFK